MVLTTEIQLRTRASEEPVYEANQDGCRFAATCLECPLPSCYYGDMSVKEQQAVKNLERDRREDELYMAPMLQALYQDGLTRTATAVRLGVSWDVIGRLYKRSQGS